MAWGWTGMADHYVAVRAGPSESGILEAGKAGGLSEREPPAAWGGHVRISDVASIPLSLSESESETASGA